jgi:hypothetical protein
MGVQIGISGAAVAVRERSRNQSPCIHLPDTVGAGPAEQGVLFDEGQRVADRGTVGFSICAATAGSASAHSVETLLTGEKVRS